MWGRGMGLLCLRLGSIGAGIEIDIGWMVGVFLCRLVVRLPRLGSWGLGICCSCFWWFIWIVACSIGTLGGGFGSY